MTFIEVVKYPYFHNNLPYKFRIETPAFFHGSGEYVHEIIPEETINLFTWYDALIQNKWNDPHSTCSVIMGCERT